jgi:hypothetical protein
MSRIAITRSDEKNLSAIIPMKNGDIIAAIPMLPYARPTRDPLNLRFSVRYVPAVTYHAPYTKYSRNIITESLARVAVMKGSLSPIFCDVPECVANNVLKCRAMRQSLSL